MRAFKRERIFFYSLIFTSLIILSCKGQTSQSESQLSQSDAIERIVLTQGTQGGVVSCELLDKDGNLWFSIKGEGVYRYDGKSFINFTVNDGLINNNVGPIIQDKSGNILLGTDRGIGQFDGKVFSKYPIPDTLSITCMLEDKNGNLWFGTSQAGVYCYNGKVLTNFLNSPKNEFNLGSHYQYILDIIQDKNDNLWFSSWNGGGVWKYDGKEFINFLPPPEYYKENQDKRGLPISTQNRINNPIIGTFHSSKDYISDDMIFSMLEDNSGNIWFATRDHGLCRYNGKIFTSIGRNEGFNSRGATAILQDDSNGFWISTVDAGVWYYDGKLFKNFTVNEGLVNNAVMNILKDKEGFLWFGTKYLGLSRFDGKTFKTFSQLEN